MEYFAEYLVYLAEAITIVVAIIVVFASIVAIASKGKSKQKGKLTIKKLNRAFDDIEQMMQHETLDKKQLKALNKSTKATKKTKQKKTKDKAKLFVIHFHGDIRASALDSLRKEITAVILAAKRHDEVLVCVESGGGMVNAYGLAASQLQRLRDAKLKLTVAVDKIAASGGYMMAAVSDKIIAAPFAVIGSIGVIAQIPNFHRFLEKKNIDFEQLTAGEYKRTLTLFGENTKQGRAKLQDEIDVTHNLFKDFIKQHRSQLDIDKVATGEHWYGLDALRLQLIDEILTSDDYILQARQHTDIFEVKYETKKPLSKKLAQGASAFITKLFDGNRSHGQDYI